jgi:CubicO group peptidase (beta-lactamase class C family)
MDTRYSLGFIKPGPKDPFGSPGSFGMPGTGGSFGFADPEHEIGFGYVLNGIGTAFPFDPSALALSKSMYDALGIEISPMDR